MINFYQIIKYIQIMDVMNSDLTKYQIFSQILDQIPRLIKNLLIMIPLLNKNKMDILLFV